MTGFPPDPLAEPPAPAATDAARPSAGRIAMRVLAAIAGVAILLLLARVAFRLTLGSLIGLGVVARHQAVRRGRAGGVASWLGASLGAALVLVVTMAVRIERMPAGTLPKMRDSLRTARDTAPEPLPPWLEKIAGGQQRVQASREMAKQLERSPALFWWLTALSLMMSSALLGFLVGGLTWAAAMLAAYGITGRWRLATPRPPPSVAT